MPEWLNSTVVVAAIGAAGLIFQHLLNRQGRKEEMSATDRDNLVKRLGEQVDRLDRAQQHDRLRIDWLEDELWSERKNSHRLHRNLGGHVDWGEDMVLWAESDRDRPYPVPPDFMASRKLLDAPRPRHPPPTADAT